MQIPTPPVQRILRMVSVAIGLYLNTVWMKKTVTKIDDFLWFIIILSVLILGLRST